MNTLGDIFVVKDALDAVLLGAFFFGLLFTAASLVLGAAEVGAGHGGQIGHGHGAHGHAGHGHGTNHQGDRGSAGAVFNVATILGFLTWFGGFAYLLRNWAGVYAPISLLGGVIAGIFAAKLVVRMLRLFREQERYLSAENERLTGSLGRVTSSIRANGVGEIVYELNGVRQVIAARAINDSPIPRGAQVIVLAKNRGIATVEPWREVDPHEEWERRLAVEAGPIDSAGPPGNEN